MAKININSLFVMALLASPSFAMFFSSEPRGIEDMDAREFDEVFRRDIQHHKDTWQDIDMSLRVIYIPWLPMLGNKFMEKYRDLVLHRNGTHHHHKNHHHTAPITTGTSGTGAASVSTPSAPALSPGAGAPPAGSLAADTAPVAMPIPVVNPPVLDGPPFANPSGGAQAALAARELEYMQDLVERTYASFQGAELDARGYYADEDELAAREPMFEEEVYEREPMYEDEMYERGFDDELYERGYDEEEFVAREYDELDAREFEDVMDARDVADFEEMQARGLADEAFEAMFGRDYDFDDLD